MEPDWVWSMSDISCSIREQICWTQARLSSKCYIAHIDIKGREGKGGGVTVGTDWACSTMVTFHEYIKLLHVCMGIIWITWNIYIHICIDIKGRDGKGGCVTVGTDWVCSTMVTFQDYIKLLHVCVGIIWITRNIYPYMHWYQRLRRQRGLCDSGDRLSLLHNGNFPGIY